MRSAAILNNQPQMARMGAKKHTIMGGAAHVPQLAEERCALLLDSFYNRLPSLNLLLCIYARRLRVSTDMKVHASAGTCIHCRD